MQLIGRGAGHRQHGAGHLGGRGHQLAAAPGHAQHLVRVQHPRGAQRGHLAEAVPAHTRRLQVQLTHQLQRGQAGRAQGRLGPLRRGQLLGLQLDLLLVKRGGREDHPVQRLGPQVHARGAIPRRARGVEVQRQVRPHVEVLATLARKEERQLPVGRRPQAIVDAGRQGDRHLGPGLDQLGRPRQLAQQILGVAGHHRQPRGLRRIKVQLTGARQPPQRALVGLPLGQLATLSQQPLRIGGAQQHQVHRRSAQRAGRIGRAAILLQGDVKVGAAKAKGADPGAPRVRPVADPGPGHAVEVERALLDLHRRVRPLDLDRGGQHLVVQRQGRLDQPRHPGRALGVADLGLDRAQRAPLARRVLSLVKDHAQAAKLLDVAGQRAGAVSLHQLNRVRRVTRHLVGSAQGHSLALGPRGVDALGPPVRRGPHALDHGVHPVAVALGVGQALERQHAQALAQHGPVGGLGEGPAVARVR